MQNILLYIFIAITKSCLLEFPSKHLVEDAVQLSKHLQNRGRPTERTWTKYKEAKAARKQLKGLQYTRNMVIQHQFPLYPVNQPSLTRSFLIPLALI